MEALKVLVLAEVLSCQREPTGVASQFGSQFGC